MTATKTMAMSAEGIIGLADEAKALPVILSGVLDGKIAECKKLISELKQRQGIVTTMDAAQEEFDRAKRLIDEHSAQAMATQQAASNAASTLMEQANARMAAAEKREQNSMAERDAVQRQVQEAAIRAAEIERLRGEMNAKENNLSQREAALAKAEEKLRADQATVNARLDALKV